MSSAIFCAPNAAQTETEAGKCAVLLAFL